MDKVIERPSDLEEVSIRTIEKQDNPAIASIIRNTLAEFGANHPGTVYYDEATDHLYESFSVNKSSVYYVAEYKGSLLGGGGIYPSPGLPSDTCELVKMYLLPHGRGIGLGSTLISKCIDFARNTGYKNIYLETMPELKQALHTYAKFGFQYLSGPMGNTGHFGCELWMKLTLED
jgi:putative acetyltransferase